MTHERKINEEKDFSLKNLFVPLTTLKAFNWIVIIGIIVYFNCLFNGFVWDDLTYIIHYPLINSLNILDIFGKNFYNLGSQYRPIPLLYFSILYYLFTTSSFYYHIFQLLIHLTNVVLIYLLFKKFLNNIVSFFMSLIFLVHPIQVESVSYIASAGNPLFCLFGLIALHLSLNKKVDLYRYVTVFCLLLLSLLTKETGIAFIFIILTYMYLFQKKHILIYFVGSCITVLSYLLIRFLFVGFPYQQSQLSPIANLPLMQRLLNIPAILMHYFIMVFFPVNLSIEQFWVAKNINILNFYIPLLVIISFIIALFIFLKTYINENKTKLVFIFFLTWFIYGMTALLQIIPIDYTTADRWFYLPFIGLLGLLGLISQQVIYKYKQSKTFFLIFIISLLFILSVRSIIRNTDWQNAITLYTHDIKINDNYDLENNLGGEYFKNGDYYNALIHYKKSEELLPYELNIYNVASAYENLKSFTNAKSQYLKVIKLNKFVVNVKFKQYAYESYAKISSFYENPNEKDMQFIKKGLKIYPNSGIMWASLAYGEYILNNYPTALESAKRADQIVNNVNTKYLLNQIINKRVVDKRLL